MSGKSNMSKRYTPEFKRDAAALVRSSGRNVTEAARELGVSPEGLRGWVKQAKIDRGEGAPGALTTAEREELQRLRRESRELVTDALRMAAGRGDLPRRCRVAEDIRITRKTLLELPDPQPSAPLAPKLPDHPAYQQIMAVFAAADAPLRAQQVCEAMNLEIAPNNIDNTRLKLKRLTERGILVETEQRLFTQPRS
ncbi:transposase [Streptomyces atratus]|uniref:transposase n=1 Tax=Streptomyces atratus TaxID=1893 RepID=UPI0033FC9ED9